MKDLIFKGKNWVEPGLLAHASKFGKTIRSKAAHLGPLYGMIAKSADMKDWPAKYPLPSTLVLGAAALYMAQATLLSEVQVVSRAEAARSETENHTISNAEIMPIDLSEFGASLERPIFTPTRRPNEPNLAVAVPAAAPVPVAEPQTDSDEIDLLGTMETGGTPKAYLVSMSDSRWVGIGDKFEGWTVIGIQAGIVTLNLDNDFAVKQMFEQ